MQNNSLMITVNNYLMTQIFRTNQLRSQIGVFKLLLFFLFIPFFSFAQEEDKIGTEVVNIIKPYSPSVSDAFKIKEMPVLNESESLEKKNVNYSIFSVPVASTFTPAKGKATAVKKAKPIKLYDNYASIGYGNYSNVLAELYSNFEISRTDNFGLTLKHNSSQGGIEGIVLDNKFYDTNLDGNYTSRQKDKTFQINAGVEHQIFNWYGLNSIFDEASNEFLNEIDPKQTYLSGYLGASIDLDDSFFEQGSATIRYLGDDFESTEFNVSVLPEFSFPLSTSNSEFVVKVDGELDYLSGSFATDYFNITAINYSFLNAGISPSFVYVNDDLTLSVGASAYVSVDSENSKTDFYLYPNLNISYRLNDEFVIVYGGADGGLEQNSFYNFKEENPFVSPTLAIMPTSELYNGFVGLKGKLNGKVGYNIRASYGKEDQKALFITNPYKGMSMDYKGYEHGNSFNVVYDDVNTLSFYGELKIETSENFSIGFSGTVNSYETTSQMEAWNLPDLEVSLFSNFNISEALYGGFSIFYVGERKDELLGGGVLPPLEVITLESYVDANVHFGYRINEKLSVFAKGSNLFGDNYNKWINYPVQGIQGLLGLSYKFDW